MKDAGISGGANRGALSRGLPLRFQLRNGQIVPTAPQAISVHIGNAEAKPSGDGRVVVRATNRTSAQAARADIQPPQPAHLRGKIRGRGGEFLAATALFTCALALLGAAGYGLVVGAGSILRVTPSAADQPEVKLDFDTVALYRACEQTVHSRLHYPSSFSIKLFTTSYGRSTITNEPLVRFDFDALNGLGLRVPQVARCIQRATGLEAHIDAQ